MSQDEFTKLYAFMQKEFTEVESRLDEIATKEFEDLTAKINDLILLIRKHQNTR